MCKQAVTSKAFLAALSLIFWGVAGGLIFIGAWVYNEYQNYDQIAEAKFTLIPATILIASGVFIFLLGIIGCVGAFREQKCLLALFFTLLLIIFVGLVAASALAYVYRDQVDSKVEEGISDGLRFYHLKNETVWKTEMDFMQTKLKCCGSHNYTDWENTTWYMEHKQTNASVKYPESCCIDQKCAYKNTTEAYQNGCYSLLKDQFLNHLGIIAGVGAAFALVQILGMVCSCVLICRRKTEVPYIGLDEPNGLRV